MAPFYGGKAFDQKMVLLGELVQSGVSVYSAVAETYPHPSTRDACDQAMFGKRPVGTW